MIKLNEKQISYLKENHKLAWYILYHIYIFIIFLLYISILILL